MDHIMAWFADQSELYGALLRSGLLAAGFFVAWFLLHQVEKRIVRLIVRIKKRYAITHGRFERYIRIFYLSVLFLIGVAALSALADIWFSREFLGAIPAKVQQGLGFLGKQALTILVFVFIWEGIATSLELRFKNAGVGRKARLRTVMPFIRTVSFMILAALYGLSLLQALNIDILPLLAGAGVVGVALGFGAQTLVKDFLVSIGIIFEDIVKIGDVVRIGSYAGLVENITLRYIQLRGLDGVVSTIPFSEVKIIENLTKDFSYYVFDISVAYHSDIEKVLEVITLTGENIYQDKNFQPLILEKLEILGVDRFADSAIIIKARIKTLPIQQWNVGREFNKRLKQAFDQHGIEIPFPQRVVHMRQPSEKLHNQKNS
ncbi:MAG: mechanosensitive ion channel family protein [Dongiaceae bacterium]